MKNRRSQRDEVSGAPVNTDRKERTLRGLYTSASRALRQHRFVIRSRGRNTRRECLPTATMQSRWNAGVMNKKIILGTVGIYSANEKYYFFVHGIIK